MFEVVLTFKIAFVEPDALFIEGIQGRYMIVPWTLTFLALIAASPLKERLKCLKAPALNIWMLCSASMFERVLKGYFPDWH